MPQSCINFGPTYEDISEILPRFASEQRSNRLSLTLIEFPSGRYYALHPKVGLRWVNYSNRFTSFRICHMVQRSLTKFFNVVHNYVGHWLDLIQNMSYGPIAIILGLSSEEKEVD